MKRQEVINILSKHFLDNYSKDLKNYEILKQSYILAMKSLNITQQEYSLLYDTFGSDFTKKYYNEISKEEATDILIKDFLDNHSDNSPKLKEAYDFVIKASDGKYKECDIIKKFQR